MCDEQIRILRAPDEDAAFKKALQLGKDQEHSYENSEGEVIKWEFIGMENVEELVGDSVEDGTEIRSRIFEHHDPRTIIREKEKLLIYRAIHNKDRKAYEIIDEADPSDKG